MDSPLTRQFRPDTFEPKIVELYRHLFHTLSYDGNEDSIPPEGFWRELFLLKPDKKRLYDILEPLSAGDMLHIQAHTRLFFRRAIEEAGSGISPRNENALENLTGFLSAVLNKRYMNPSTDVIEVLAGLNTIDKIVTDLVQGLEAIIRQSTSLSFRRRAVDTALSMVAGSYQTSLVTYFIHRDLFPALMKYARDSTESSPELLVLLGLLASYNKFESQNLYQNRLEDCVNEDTIQELVREFVQECANIRNRYINVQDDSPTSWNITSTLQMIGLRSLTSEPQKPIPPTEEEAKALFNNLPPCSSSLILAAYSFVQANKIFASHLVSATSSKSNPESPMATFLSSTSYLCHHAYRNTRSSHYAILSLLIVRILVEDPVTVKQLSSGDDKTVFRLARQRAPYLPHIFAHRIPAVAILDICTDTLSHNLRRRLSIPLYSLCLTVLHSLITHLDSTKTRLHHHWSYIWGSLLSLLRFLTQYASDLTSAPGQATQIRAEICTPLTSLLAFCLSRGDNFLPDPASYDDLFYKLIEVTATLAKFKTMYCPPSASTTTTTTGTSNFASTASSNNLALAVDALLSVTSHYQDILSSKTKQHQSPVAIQKIIKEGYETLPDIASPTAIKGTQLTGNARLVDFGYREKWRDSDWKGEIKRILRTVVDDAKVIALKSDRS